jgi:AraC-like DNA-binding protein
VSLDIEFVKKLIVTEIQYVKTVTALARSLHVPERTLRRQFAHYEGLGISKFMVKARADRAKGLLLNSGMTCKEILLSVGFSRVDVGSRAFKISTGLTMKEYRHQGRARMGK